MTISDDTLKAVAQNKHAVKLISLVEAHAKEQGKPITEFGELLGIIAVGAIASTPGMLRKIQADTQESRTLTPPTGGNWEVTGHCTFCGDEMYAPNGSMAYHAEEVRRNLKHYTDAGHCFHHPEPGCCMNDEF